MSLPALKIAIKQIYGRAKESVCVTTSLHPHGTSSSFFMRNTELDQVPWGTDYYILSMD